MTGFEVAPATASTLSATSSAGGFETITMTEVSGSASRARMLSIIEMPPISEDRSRPPVPSNWDTPPPKSWMRTESSWLPVPEAPTMPMFPRRTAFAKARPTPLMIAVPQSGPITSRPFSWASVFSASSSSTDTLSEKIMTCLPAFSALRASRAAKAPLTEMITRFVSATWLNAPSRVR